MAERRRIQLIWLGLGALALGLVYLLGMSLLPFLLGGLLALLLTPLVDRLEAGGTPRGWAAALITLVFLFILSAALAVLLPMLASQLGNLARQLPEILTDLRETLERVAGPYLGEILGTAPGAEGFLDTVAQRGADAVTTLLSYGGTLLDLALLVVLTPFVTFYLLRDWHKAVAVGRSLVPRASAPAVQELAEELSNRILAYIRGQALVAVVLAILHAGGLTLIGLNFALLIGFGTGLLSFIPVIGNLIMFVTAMAMALIQFDNLWQPALVAAVFVVSQVLEDSVLVPNLVGHRIRLHPVWVIFALLVGAKLLGLIGVLLAMPFAAMGEVLGRMIAKRYRDSVLYRES